MFQDPDLKPQTSPQKQGNENIDPKIRDLLAAQAKEKALMVQKLEFKTLELEDLQQSFNDYKQVTEKMIKSLQDSSKCEQLDQQILTQK